jgi:hypothetical protein
LTRTHGHKVYLYFMIYTLYRKNTGEDAGQVLAIVSEHKSKVIDKFQVVTITNGSPIEIKIYKDNDIKVYGDGRPLWSEITWENNKWEIVQTEVDLGEVVAGMSSPNFKESLAELSHYF